MYSMTNCGKLFSDEVTEWLLEAYFIQFQYHMSIYYKYAPYGTKIVLSYLMLITMYIGIHMRLLRNDL